MLLVLQDNLIFHVVRVPILEDVIMVSNRVTHDSVLTVCSYESVKTKAISIGKTSCVTGALDPRSSEE
jgi:hypothetical protein